MQVETELHKMAAGAEQAVKLLKALGNKQRLMVLCLLQQGEMRVSDINDKLPIPQSSLSQHLAALRQDGLVGTRRDKQSIFYRVISDDVRAVIDTLYKLYCR